MGGLISRLRNRIEIGVADPLPAVCSFFPQAQARSRLRRQLLEIDRLLHRNHIGNHNVVAAHGRSKIVKRYLADVQVFDQGYFTRPVARSIRMNGLKTLSDFTFHRFPILRLDVSPHLFFHFFAVVAR
jgi:hypothetical protein